MVSSTYKTDCHDITEILLKVALNTIKPNNKGEKMTKQSKYHGKTIELALSGIRTHNINGDRHRLHR
jgi:hypothetical protein